MLSWNCYVEMCFSHHLLSGTGILRCSCFCYLKSFFYIEELISDHFRGELIIQYQSVMVWTALARYIAVPKRPFKYRYLSRIFREIRCLWDRREPLHSLHKRGTNVLLDLRFKPLQYRMNFSLSWLQRVGGDYPNFRQNVKYLELQFFLKPRVGSMLVMIPFWYLGEGGGGVSKEIDNRTCHYD